MIKGFLIISIISIISIVSSFIHNLPTKRMIKPQLSIIQMSEEDESYDAIGTLIRQGPVPYFIRITNPDTYNAAVEKYMMKEGCSKIEAMANMDAYFQDPNGWAGNKLKEKSGKISKIDYVNMNTDPFQLVITGIWAVGIISLFGRIIQLNAF